MSDDSITLILPPQIDSSDKAQAIRQLEDLKKNTLDEIDSCFQPASRTARGSYKKK